MSGVAIVEDTGKQRRWTGWHTLATLVGFFGVIFTVNGIMTYIALSTFSGIETPNAYQFGRDYNQTLEAAAAQQALGWQVGFDEVFAPTPEGANARVTISVRDTNDMPLTGLSGALTFWRPVARGDDVEAQLVETAPGIYSTSAALSARGHWEMRLLFARNGADPYYLEKRIWAGGRDEGRDENG